MTDDTRTSLTEQLANDDGVALDTGVDGLNEVLCGGLPPQRLCVVEGDPGAGKTTLALQFVLAGVRRGEACLFVTLSETEVELRAAAASHGWSLDGVDILELIPSEASLTPDARYTMYHPSEVELGETTKAVLSETQRIKPKRLVFDSVAALRVLAESPVRYRRQILALKQHFVQSGCTILFVDDRSSQKPDFHLHSVAHGVITLEATSVEFGTLRRRLQVRKMRGCAFREGFHDFVIRKGGLAVFPRLIAAEQSGTFESGSISSGLASLDELLGGGLTRGTSTLLLGPTGTGKSAIVTQYAVTAAARGERSAMFLFDETVATLIERSLGLGLDVKPLMEAGTVSVRQVDPAQLSPGEFSHLVRAAVEDGNASLVVIDSLTGYMNAMPSERFVSLHLHDLLSYLGQRGVTTLVVAAQHGIFGSDNQNAVDASYLADTVLLLRYFEALGELRQAISVVKKRTGKHERTIRELRFDKGLHVGPPLLDFHGVLTGTPELLGRGKSHAESA
jgi:circadian clock protein KaiC